MRNNDGILYWLTGLSGAGKSTIGRELYGLIRRKKPNVILLDGDILREVFGETQNYTSAARLELATQYCRLCKMLTDQGIDVICATISLFPECWSWNREHIPYYCEIYIRVSMDILIKRDQKQLYSRGIRGEIDHVMGVDIPHKEPETPDLIIDNNGFESPLVKANQILNLMER